MLNYGWSRAQTWREIAELCASGFFCLLCVWLPSLTTLEWIDQQHFAKIKMGYISLPLLLNAIIGRPAKNYIV